MSENTMPEQDEVSLNAVPEPTAVEAANDVPAGLENVDQEKLAKLRAAVQKFAKTDRKTISGSEAPADEKAPENTGDVTTGADVDWSEYELEFSVRHLYKGATFRMTNQGPKWVAMIDEFESRERDWGNLGKKVNNGTEFLNVAQFLNDMLNSPEGWTVVSILPAGMSRVGVLLRRSVPIILPDPKPLKKETEVEAPGDPELKREEDAALAFMAGEGLTPEAPITENGDGEPVSVAPLVAQALAINPPTERDPSGVPEGSITRPGEEVRESVIQARDGEDFEKKVDETGRVEG